MESPGLLVFTRNSTLEYIVDRRAFINETLEGLLNKVTLYCKNNGWPRMSSQLKPYL